MPFQVRGEGAVAGGTVHIDASSSSQFVSGLLLSGATFQDGLTVVHTGESVPSAPHVAMTVTMLREAGVSVDDATPNRWVIRPGPVAARHWDVEPDLSNAVSLEVTALASLAGQWPIDRGLIRRPRLQAPHHSASATAILGTARGRQVIPGALTLAHHGVLFLDEAPEFTRPCLEGLRQPMESGVITVMRAAHSVTLPAQFQLVLASNPCPCGLAVGRGDACTCTPMARRRYAERLSGPLLDRVDVRLALSRPTAAELESSGQESSSEIRGRVIEARLRASTRFADESWLLNAQLPGASMRGRWRPTAEAAELVRSAEQKGASLRSLDRVMRMAWTLADLGAEPKPTADHVATAMGLRGPEHRGER